MSVEEKIRKAEEIYNKRRGIEMTPKTNNIEVAQTSLVMRKMKKLFIQLSVSVIVYFILYSTDFGTVIFSQETAESVKSVLRTDMDFYGLYNNVVTYIQSIIPKEEDTNIDNNVETTNEINDNNPEVLNNIETTNDNNPEVINETEGNVIESINSIEINSVEETNNIQNTAQINVEAENITNEAPETIDNIIENKEVEDISDEVNIGGATEIYEDSKTTFEEQKTQMELDAEYVLSKVQFIKPLNNYQISSRYGLRNPTTASVPKNHKGIDLAAETGTKIISATEGTVILASSQGDYGNHLKIQIDDIIIVYAHCNKLYVKEGEEVSIGQEIAEVGSTGNSTGPHLHFEVRVENRIVDPEYILDFS